MVRNIVFVFFAFTLMAPISVYGIIWVGEPTNNIEIAIQIDSFIQIDWQNTEMAFGQGTDWWYPQLMGIPGQSCPSPDGCYPGDPWAGDVNGPAGANGYFYEEGVGAWVYVHANTDLSMWVTTNGDLEGQTNSSNHIPTWFHVCLCPFMINSQWLMTGIVPGSGGQYGSFLFDAGSGQFGYDDPTYNHPNQWLFPCDPSAITWQLGPMQPETQGTIMFHCRIERHGMADPGDEYYTWLDVSFTSP